MTASDEHQRAIDDETAGRPWPEHPSAIYTLARLRRIEALRIDRIIRQVMAFQGKSWPRCT